MNLKAYGKNLLWSNVKYITAFAGGTKETPVSIASLLAEM